MDTLKGKTCLVTGGAGFVGSHLVEALVSVGAQVRVLDIKECMIANAYPERIHAVIGSVTDQKAVDDIMNGADVVFHLAALASVQDSIERPDAYHKTNVEGTFRVLEAARTSALRPRVVIVSSAAVYGDQDVVEVHEDLVPHPMSPYALTKRMTELYAALWSKLYKIETVVIRPFNIYGTGMNVSGPYASAIAAFLKARKENNSIQITGDGKQTRDFVHIRDMVSAYFAAALSPRVGAGEIINVASGTCVTMNEVAALIGGEVEYIPARVEIRHSGADITKARELLSWSPVVSLEDGIAELKKEAGIV